MAHCASHAEVWCAASTCSMGTKLSMSRSKKTQTQRQGTLFLHTCIAEPLDGAGSGARSETREIHGPGWTEIRIPDSEIRFSHGKTNLSDGSMKLFKKKQKKLNSRGAVGTFTDAVASARSKVTKTTAPCTYTRARSPGQKDLLIDRGGNLAHPLPHLPPSPLTIHPLHQSLPLRFNPRHDTVHGHLCSTRHFFGDVISCPLLSLRFHDRLHLVKVLGICTQIVPPASDISVPSRFLKNAEMLFSAMAKSLSETVSVSGIVTGATDNVLGVGSEDVIAQ